jgi:hypothetical protein
MRDDQFVVTKDAQSFIAEAIEAGPGDRRVLDLADRTVPVNGAEIAIAEQFGHRMRHQVLRGH